MKVLAFNVGSSSVKYALFNHSKKLETTNIDRVTTQKQRERIVGEIIRDLDVRDFKPDIITHRVVHGKDIISPKKIDRKLIKKIESISELAPLHIIPEVEVIKKTYKEFKCKQLALFDTAFHSTIPKEAAMYGLPKEYYEKGIKKYGFHGLSHKYVTRGLKGKTISCHLGSGSSITAIKNGASVETSMGFTPLEGVPMSTRSGSLDPSIITYLIEKEDMSLEDLKHLLNKESGLKGLSGKSSDMRDLLNSKDKDSKMAVNVFCNRVREYIGSYSVVLGGVNNIVFTGGIGENNAFIRQKILKNLDFLGLKLSNVKNEQGERIISDSSSKVNIYVIPTDEEFEMALEAEEYKDV